MTPYTTAINALDKGEWQAAVDEFRGAIEIAQVVGADRLRVYAGHGNRTSGTTRPTGTSWSRPCAHWPRKPPTPGYGFASRTISAP